MKKIAIIGGGASGLAAAISAAQAQGFQSYDGKGSSSLALQLGVDTPSFHISLFEQADRIGKSILASGNGRCNFSNSTSVPEVYYNQAFVAESFVAFSPEKVRTFFKTIGLMWYEENEGRLYPATNKASSVLDTLRFAAQDKGVEIAVGKTVYAVTPIEQKNSSLESSNATFPNNAIADQEKTSVATFPTASIKSEQNLQPRKQFLVSFDDDTALVFDAVIVACGGKVARSLLPIGYAFHNTQPMLGSLKTDTKDIRGLNNLRVRCSVSIQQGKYTEQGEVLFRDYGLSGIAIFNLSRFVSAGDMLTIDFFPNIGFPELEAALRQRSKVLGSRSALRYCAGMLQPSLARAVLRKAGIDAEEPFAIQAIASLARTLKEFSLIVHGIENHRQCQVHRGGFAVDAFNPKTFESKEDAGLFVVGEALDVDGPCGGFNLHWAWTSGILAGRTAATSLLC